MKTTPLILLFALSGPVFAADPAVEKECIRLEAEISALSAKNAWSGVERAYSGVVSSNGEKTAGYAELGCSDPVALKTASEAARLAGNVREQLKRLLAANKSCKEREATTPCPQAFKDELAASAAAIVCNSAAADPAWILEPDRKKAIEKEAKKAGTPVGPLIVRPAGNFFEPDKNQVVTFANEKLWETGKFNGYLPAGEYAVDGQIKLITPDTSKLAQIWGVQCSK